MCQKVSLARAEVGLEMTGILLTLIQDLLEFVLDVFQLPRDLSNSFWMMSPMLDGS